METLPSKARYHVGMAQREKKHPPIRPISGEAMARAAWAVPPGMHASKPLTCCASSCQTLYGVESYRC